MFSIELKHRVVVVTGAAGALGGAVLKAAADAGATAVGLDSAAPPVGSPGHSAAPVDLRDAAATAAAMASIHERFGRIDGLVNAAGTFDFALAEASGVEVWDRLYAINLRTAVNASQAALRYLLQQPASRIVNVGAAAAAKAARGMGAYAASKAGVAKLTESWADEFGHRGLAVNAVLPSILDTPGNRRAMPDADTRGWVSLPAVADVIIFLLSPGSSAINGASIPVVAGGVRQPGEA